MEQHQPDESSMNLVVTGEFLERIGTDERTYSRGTARVLSGGAPHLSSPAFRDLGDKLVRELHQADGFSPVACEGIMLEIIAAFGRKKPAAKVNAHPPGWLRAAREFMHENAFVPLTMAQIAREAGRHEIHLAREFRRFFGLSVGAYLRRLRVEQAGRLLMKPQISISETAHSCGFASHSHLCREFKAHFGIAPSEYRARNR